MSERRNGIDPGFDHDDWARPERPPVDWKKAILVIGLGTLSWVATYVGMLELIESNMGALPLQHRVIIGFAVAMLMIMIVWLLDQIFSPAPFARKVIYAAGYVFLTLISVGFGFGFYWKVLESRSEATRSAQSAVGQVQTAMHAGSTRLTQLNSTLVQLRDLSQKKAVEEREKGTSCPNSRPGDGPRRALRDADAEKFAFASQFVAGRIDELNRELATFEGELAKISNENAAAIEGADGTRNEFMRGLDRRLDIAVAGFNAFRTDPQLLQIRQDLAARAEKTVFATSTGGTFSCPDPQLQAALRGVVRAIDQLPQLGQPKIAAVEGSEATVEAFRRLTATLFGVLTFELPPSPEDLRELQREAVKTATETGNAAKEAAFEAPPAGLSKRDYIPLALAVFVDLCLLLVSMGRPMNRFGGLVDKMREAEKGPVIRILSRFNDIHRDEDVRRNFEVFRHVVFDFHGAYYVAVPLDTPYNRVDPRSRQAVHYGASDAQDLQHEAHLLSNLFSSFEKEKIFTRVYSPILTTRGIQKRLARQGSKFAGSSAFRLYRFKDGAWSDLILGAVMGAAKRVEAEQRRRSMAAGPTLPENGQAEDVSSPLERRPRQGYDRDAADTAGSRVAEARSFDADDDAGDRRSDIDARDDDGLRDVPPSSVLFAHSGDGRVRVHPRSQERPPSREPDWARTDVRPQRRPSASAEAFSSQFGSYAAAARAELAAAETSLDLGDTGGAAHAAAEAGLTGAGADPVRDAQVIALPARAAVPGASVSPPPSASSETAAFEPQPAITPPPLPRAFSHNREERQAVRETQVTLMRETATFSVSAEAIGLTRPIAGFSGRFEEHGERLLEKPVDPDADDDTFDGPKEAFGAYDGGADEFFLEQHDFDEAATARTLARRLSPENKD